MKPSQIYSKNISVLINDILRELYPNNIGSINEPLCKTREGFIDDDFPAEEGDRWSILNYMYSNNAMRSQMFDYFLEDFTEVDKSVENFIKWILNNKEKLFGKKGIEAEKLRDIVWKTNQKGWALEKKTLEKIKNESGLTDEDILVFCKGSPQDEKGGIDFVIKNKGFQIKPLISATMKDGKWEVVAKGMNETYLNKPKLNWIVYSNDDQVLVFKNSDYRVIVGGPKHKEVMIQHDKSPVRTLIF